MALSKLIISFFFIVDLNLLQAGELKVDEANQRKLQDILEWYFLSDNWIRSDLEIDPSPFIGIEKYGVPLQLTISFSNLGSKEPTHLVNIFKN